MHLHFFTVTQLLMCAARDDTCLYGACGMMSCRTSRPLLLGVMWFDASPDALQQPGSPLRHEAEQQDKLTSYGWLRHDGRSYGRQQLIDGHFNITVQMVCAL